MESTFSGKIVRKRTKGFNETTDDDLVYHYMDKQGYTLDLGSPAKRLDTGNETDMCNEYAQMVKGMVTSGVLPQHNTIASVPESTADLNRLKLMRNSPLPFSGSKGGGL